MTQETRQAFALIFFDISATPPTVLGIEIFSEDNPSMLGRNRRYATVLTGYGHNFEEGLAHLKGQLGDPFNAWMLPLLKGRLP